ncbi:MAG: hypothetical protein GEU82_13695, partial [Luteitalea sp.]|nr:hypothetical protein [Luteitalea sp.]
AAVIVSQTAWFKNWLRGYIVAEANKYLNGQLSIQRLGGNLFFGVELENIGISMDGSQVVAVEDLGLDYNVFQMISRGLSLDEVRLNKPVLYLRREGDTWSIARLVKKQEQEADREGPQLPISIGEIGVSDASIVIDDPVGTSGVDLPDRIERLDAKLAFEYEPVRYSIDITHVSFRGSDPAIGLNALSGGVAVRNDTLFVENLALRTEETSLSLDGAVQHYLTTPTFNLQVSSDKVSLPELGRLFPSLAGIALQPAFEVKLNGPLDRLGVDMNVRSSAGQMTGTLVTDLMAPGQAVSGALSILHLDLAPFLNDPGQKSDITADAKVDLRADDLAQIDSIRGTASLSSPRVAAAGYTAERINADAQIEGRRVNLEGRASAYGTLATARGHVVVPQGDDPLAFDLRGQARGFDLRRLPPGLKAPPAESNLSADYHVAGTLASPPPPSGGGRTAQRASRPMAVQGDVRFADSTIAGARVVGGSRVGFAVGGPRVAYDADATIENVDLQRFGAELNVPALASDQYKSVLNAQITATGSGTAAGELDVKATGSLTDSSVMGGQIPRVDFDAAVADDSAQVKANGSFAGFGPAVASGKPAMQGTVGGTLEMDATIEGFSAGVTEKNVAGTVRVTLDPSVVGGLAIDRASVDADYRDMAGEIRQLEIVGRDLNVTAQGVLALNDTGQSDLTFHVDSPRLEEIGKLVDTPVSGIANVDGTLTGNRSQLQASGTLTGNGVKYQENGALAIESRFNIRVPELAFAAAEIEADTDATFISVGGQNINELTARTTYGDKRITFDAIARQPNRELSAAGSVTLQPELQEIRLDRLALQTAGQQWAIAEGTTPAIDYGQDAVSVENLRLVNGPQEIVADGTFGRPGDAFTLALNRVDLASVDALLLRPPQFTGQLNASASVTGTRTEPEVKAEFAVTQGGFSDFKYDRLGGTLDYSGKVVTLDTRLQQNPAQWISAKGYLPVALFSGTQEGANERVDLTVDSSPLDLGLVQGFTTALTDVQGTLEAHVRVTGTANDPQPSGTVSIAKGALTVAPTGAAYANIAGTVELQPDRVHIPLITVLDNHNSWLTLTGDLSVQRRQVGGFELWVNADDFKVIDNEMGEVRIQSAVQITGDLRAPEVNGDFGITTGQLNLDEIIALATSSAYATEQLKYADQAGAEPGAVEPAPASAFDALRMNVRLTVPNDLVIRASSLQTPGSPVSLGALTLTIGGELTAIKETGSSPRLRGEVNTVRGDYDFQGRRFEILRDGTVRFEGTEEFDPTLDIRTRRLIQGVEARVNIRGTLKRPEIVLSSTPPLEQADILALIVFNQPLNQLGEGQQVSLAQRAQSLATGAVAGQLAQSIGNALNLDQFEIDLAPESGGGPEVTLGQQLGQNLYVKVQQGVGDQSSTNFVLEYELTNWLRLQTNVIQGSSTQQSLFRRAQSTGADLIFFFSY